MIEIDIDMVTQNRIERDTVVLSMFSLNLDIVNGRSQAHTE